MKYQLHMQNIAQPHETEEFAEAELADDKAAEEWRSSESSKHELREGHRWIVVPEGAPLFI